MKLVIIHGAPASGKVKVANALSKTWGFPVLQNQVFIDLALTVYPEAGHGDYFNFIDSVRAISIGKACKNNLNGLILTLANTKDDAQNIRDLGKIVQMQGGSLHPIYLDASTESGKQSDFLALSNPNTIIVQSASIPIEHTLAEIIALTKV